MFSGDNIWFLLFPVTLKKQDHHAHKKCLVKKKPYEVFTGVAYGLQPIPREINITRDSTLIKAIDAAAQKELEKADIHYEPAILNGNPVITRGDDHAFDYKVVIKDHQSSFEPIPERVGVTFSQPE